MMMGGMAMMLKSMGVDPEKLQAMIEAFGNDASEMRLSQERTEKMVREIHNHVFPVTVSADAIENKDAE